MTSTYESENILVEWDEDGCYLFIEDAEVGTFSVAVKDPEQLYDRVKAAILPWLMERDQALREYRAGMALARDAMEDARDAYDPSDPKHPDWHSVHADIYDNRDKTR